MCNEPTNPTKDRRDKRAAVCDHIEAHKGDEALFFAPYNLQTLHKRCHDSNKQSDEKSGYSSEIGLDGWPIDTEKHPFYRK